MVYSQRLCKMKDGSMKQTTIVLDFDEAKRFSSSYGVPPSFGISELEKRHGRRAGRGIWEDHAGSPTYGDVLAGACSSGEEAIRNGV